MTYDYNVYYRQNCVLPLSLLLFSIALLVSFILRYVRTSRSHLIGETIGAICGILIFAFLIIINAIPLARGGIYLLFEKQTDATQVSGLVERTMELGFLGGAKYQVDNNHGYGEAIVVNGETYYLTTYYDTKVGDTVAIEVLPRSRIVLRLTLAER